MQADSVAHMEAGLQPLTKRSLAEFAAMNLFANN